MTDIISRTGTNQSHRFKTSLPLDNKQPVLQTSGVTQMLSKYPPSISESIPMVTDAVSLLRSEFSLISSESTCWEFEARLGKLDPVTGRFRAGVSLEFFTSCLRRLEACKEWISIKDFGETVDFCYKIHQNIPVRTSISFGNAPQAEIPSNLSCTGASSADQVPGTKKIHLAKIHRKTVDLSTLPLTQASVSGNLWDVRVVINQEQTVPDEKIPDVVEPLHVRIKQRKTYKLTHWNIDMTMSWSGATKAVAELKQKNHDTVYEMEIECSEVGKYLANYSDTYLATSMLMKIDEFLAGTPHKLVPYSISTPN